jgi:predicted ATPase/DNA-binding SARP family transcriptional activator
VEVRVLGPVELVDGTAPVPLPQAQRTLLAALAARVGRRVPADILAEALWASTPPPSARKSLQVHVARLRRVVGAAAIVERGGYYRLDPEVVDVDAARVAEAIERSRDACRHGDAGLAVALLGDARSAFRGEPYEDVPDGAVPSGEVQRLVELRAAIVEESAEAELVRGLGERCVGELEAFVQANPCRERAWALLMRALYQAGRPADALAAFGRVRMLLAGELGIEPGPLLRDAERAILTHDPSLTPTTPSRVLGPRNLPAAVGPIVGRQLELAVLGPLLASERLITLTGTGGIGKTRLACEIANKSAVVGGGPYFVDLAPIGDVALVPNALASALGVHVEPHENAMAMVREALGDRAVVIVVDNCEHLLPDVAELVATLLSASAEVHVLATSRESLGIPGERICPVDPLQVPPDAASVEQIEASDAGALFLARLPISLSSGPLSPADLAAVGTICRTVAGIPLGLELAAAQTLTMPLPRLADSLQRSFCELAPPRHGAIPRHRTLAAALDWGYQLLSPPARAALRAMSVFAGGCDLTAIAAVCLDDGDPPAQRIIDELVRTSFVTVDRFDEQPRYRLLEPVRQYAAALLDAAGSTGDCRRRHLRHYLEVARGLTNDIDQLGIDTDWIGLRPELGNFRAALDWAAVDRDSVDCGLRLLTRLFDLWMTDEHHDEALARTEALLGLGAGSAPARSDAAYAAGFVADELGRPVSTVVQLWNQALEESRGGGDRVGEARVRRVLSHVAFMGGDYALAREHIEIAIPLAREAGNNLLHAWCLLGFADVLTLAGELDRASEQLHLALDSPVGTIPSVSAFIQDGLAQILYERGDYTAARAAATTALRLCEENAIRQLSISENLLLASIDCVIGEADGAAAHLDGAEGLTPASAHGWDPLFLIARSEVALVRGHHDEALRLAEQAEASGDHINVAAQCVVLLSVGAAQLACDKNEFALTTFEQVIDKAGRASMRCRQADGHEGAAAACTALGRSGGARDHLFAANEIRHVTNTTRLPRQPVERLLATIDDEHTTDLPDGRAAAGRSRRRD